MTFADPYPGSADRLASSRRNARIAWTMVGLALTAGGLTGWIYASVHQQFHSSYRVTSSQRTFTAVITRLSIDVTDGDIDVVGGNSTTTQVVTSATTLSVGPTDVQRRQGGVLTLDSRCATGTGVCVRTYTVHVPRQTVVSINDGTGEIQVSGMDGTVKLRDGDGPIDVADVTGTVSADTGTGGITAHDITGPTSLTSDDGTVDVVGITGSLTMRSATGSIDATHLRSSTATATSADGQVTLAFASAPQHVDVTSATGTVRVGLPQGSGPYQVHATTDTGRTLDAVDSDPTAKPVINATSQDGNVDVFYSGSS